jgi:spore germination cell wall hydrolase CwlJ-like protein
MRLAIKLFGLISVLLIIYYITVYKYSNLPTLIKPNTSYVNANNVDKMLECLAVNIFNEAGNEPFEGKVAVAQVTLNRVDHKDFPEDVCKVVYQKNVFMERVVCQFSWYCMKPIKIDKNTNSYKESMQVAKKVLLEGFRLDSLTNALFYHADYVKPNWPYRRINKIGRHIFYSNERK